MKEFVVQIKTCGPEDVVASGICATSAIAAAFLAQFAIKKWQLVFGDDPLPDSAGKINKRFYGSNKTYNTPSGYFNDTTSCNVVDPVNVGTFIGNAFDRAERKAQKQKTTKVARTAPACV